MVTIVVIQHIILKVPKYVEIVLLIILNCITTRKFYKIGQIQQKFFPSYCRTNEIKLDVFDLKGYFCQVKRWFH